MKAFDVVHYVKIKVLNKKPGDTITTLYWSGLKWETRIKFDWYFKYRAALLQVTYPKYIVEMTWGNEPATGKSLEEIRKSKIKAKKSKVTEYTNKLKLAEKNWNSLFPIQDDLNYQKAVDKIKKLQFELNVLINETNSTPSTTAAN